MCLHVVLFNLIAYSSYPTSYRIVILLRVIDSIKMIILTAFEANGGGIILPELRTVLASLVY